MKTIKVGGILEATQIAYGCMEIGGDWTSAPLTDTTKTKAVATIRAVLDAGINFFDHADIYGRGKSEEAFSAVWGERPGLRAQIVLQSKCGIRVRGAPHENDPTRYDFSYQYILDSVNGSLRRLKTDYLDILLLHRPDALVEPEEVARAFDDLERSGKVRHFGVSNHNAAQIRLLRKFVRQPIVANQVQLNVLHSQLIDEGVAFNQDKPLRALRGEGALEYCREHDITLQAWSPLARGAITGKPLNSDDPKITKTAEAVAALAQEKGVSREAILIAWLLRHPAHIQPVIGTTNVERIEACCQADGVVLTREEWYQLFAAGRGAPVP
jgi:predicted oxidoreductase